MNLLVFSDDWGRHASSCQHLVRRLLGDFQVYWVNSVGTRLPSFDLYSLQRGAEKIRNWIGPSSSTNGELECTNPRLIEPVMWPRFRTRLERRINSKLMQSAISDLISSSDCVAVTTLPIVADLVGHLPVRRWLYYCVDDLSSWPGLDGKSLETMEQDLIQRVDSTVAVSQTLVERLSSLGVSASLLTHGVDLDHWQNPSSLSSLLDEFPEPRIGFWGVIDRRLNTRWLSSLSEALGQGSILLIGPENNPDPNLGSLANVFRIGPLDYAQLPGVARALNVLIMPYDDLPVTRSMQPLKLKEYLATGRPVVVSDLPAVSEWRDACDVVSSERDFVSVVLTRLTGDLPQGQKSARRRLSEETWDKKASIFKERLLDI